MYLDDAAAPASLERGADANPPPLGNPTGGAQALHANGNSDSVQGISQATHRLKLNPYSDHKSDNYEDLDLDFSPLVFRSLERYLPPNLIVQTRDVKVSYMRDILVRYYPENERVRLQKHREYMQKIISNYQDIDEFLRNDTWGSFVSTMDWEHS